MAREYVSKRGQGTVQKPSIVGEGNYTLEEALETFILAKEAEGVRPRTIKEYRHHIRYLKLFLEEYGYKVTFVTELSAKIIREYIMYMKQTKKAVER